jgi:hypothetical protein
VLYVQTNQKKTMIASSYPGLNTSCLIRMLFVEIVHFNEQILCVAVLYLSACWMSCLGSVLAHEYLIGSRACLVLHDR